MTALTGDLRKKLENTVKGARRIAEAATKAAISRLGIGSPKPPEYLKADEQALRRRLRAHARQLGDGRDPDGSQDTIRLECECAYEHWHRMLFARFLAENELLMHPEMQVAVTLAECEEIAKEHGCDAWELAGRYAAAMLPAIFRPQDPVLAVALDPVARKSLEGLLAKLPTEVFTSQDSLGWVYQFWQADAKDAINDSGVKIGADELPAVTQLFTEPYMVQFLLHNSLGAWWAAKRLSHAQLQNAGSEQELRDAVALSDYAFTYLRFVREEGRPWHPAAGCFEHWPQHLKDFTALDPCCGSGHFLVALLELLARLRMADEGLSAHNAVDAVLRENLHGLEIDPRCTQIAAFAVALAAWTFSKAGGYRCLPPIQVACSGLRVAAKREEWMAVADRVQDDQQRERLRTGMNRLWETFQQAPMLGSLINPGQATRQGDLFSAGWSELQPLLQQALSDQILFDTEERAEIGVAARGLAYAARLLSTQHHLVSTNVPYLARGKQSEVLRDFADAHHSEAKADLATVFLDRCLELCNTGGGTAVVLPQNWLFLSGYRKFRERLLKTETLRLFARLGEGGFDSSAAAGAFTALVILTHNCPLNREGDGAPRPSEDWQIHGLDVSQPRTAQGKASELKVAEIKHAPQAKQSENPDSRIGFFERESGDFISLVADCYQGMVTGDIERFTKKLWEIDLPANVWRPFRRSNNSSSCYGDVSEIILWENGQGRLHSYANSAREQLHDMHESGNRAWGRRGIAINRMRDLSAVPYYGEHFDNNVAVIFPLVDQEITCALMCYLESADFHTAVRGLDQTIKVTNRTLLKVPFDLRHWTHVAQDRYPNGLPKPFTDDPTQWTFHGHPCGSVIWNDALKRTSIGSPRRDGTVLEVALARLIGYRWPAELDNAIELSDEQRDWVQKSHALAPHADNDGIVCLSAVRGERPAADRLRDLLADAFGAEWSAGVLAELITATGHSGMTLEVWLRDYAFKDHCDLFQQRPFMWHIWDGSRDGFSAFVNYHRLNRQGLETLIYTYLGDWISAQTRDANQKIPGAELRRAAALALQAKLQAILEGESGYDIFVRWKPLHQQPMGWDPDLDDGVRLNIRPFVKAKVLRWEPKLNYGKDRGKDTESAAWARVFSGERINDHHTSLADKRAARATTAAKGR